MESEKGITIASLAIYVVVIFVVLAILATITANMQSGIKKSNKEGTEVIEINKFNMYFLREVKKVGNSIETCTNNQIEFSNGNIYKFNNNKIELKEKGKTIVISKNIDNCVFGTKTENEKTIITVVIKAKNSSNVLTNEYVLMGIEQEDNYTNEEDFIYNMATSN